MFKNNRYKPVILEIVALIALVLSWRVVLFIVGYLANFILPYQPSFPYADAILLNRELPQWLVSWANFDGVHYLTIIEKGYFGTGLIQAFFPVFPLLVKFFTLQLIDPIIVGLIISNLLFLAFVVALFYYIKKRTSGTQAWWTVITVLLFPTSFFFGGFYTESLFLLLVLLSLWLAEEKKWLWAGLLASLAAATRLVGIFLVLGFALEFIQQQLATKKFPQKPSAFIGYWVQALQKTPLFILGCLIATTGLLSYMFYLHQTYGDALYFYSVQSEFGSGRQESIILLPQVIWRYLKILLTYRPINFSYFAYLQEIIATGLVYLMLLLSAKKVRWSWTGFSLLAITLPTLTGTFSSMPRYILVALPLFWFLGNKMTVGNQLWKLWLVLASILLLSNTFLFIQGYWVA